MDTNEKDKTEKIPEPLDYREFEEGLSQPATEPLNSTFMTAEKTAEETAKVATPEKVLRNKYDGKYILFIII